MILIDKLCWRRHNK